MGKRENRERKKIRFNMRSMHRDIGFFVIGITIIYGLSGIVLLYRDTDFLKSEKLVERTLEPNMKISDLGMVLHMREFQVIKEEGDLVYFQNGNYNKASGEIQYRAKELPAFLNKFNQFHKTSSRNIMHYVSMIYALLLLFLAVSSFWMFKSKTNMFKRGLYLTGAGIVLTLLIFFI
ncbi:hypothetical protein [uncultured Draconibacterium sp.]|uniref:hypothetical protein n=1 Tax=uncultured Draconibacterium sp. TaxID=1573823 RepID=UPI00321733A9